MERQAGLGRSLEDVLDSLTPVEPDASAPGRVLFEPEDLEQQLDQLMADIRDLRERVQHLVGLVPGAALAHDGANGNAVVEEDEDPSTKKTKTTKNKHKKKKHKKKKQATGKQRSKQPAASA